jgi:hypothetical protein
VYDDRSYKAELIDMRDAPVIALGSSRVMQFRKEMFISPGMFSNAGGAVPQLDEARRFLLALPREAVPRVIILGLDQNFFKPSWHPTLSPEEVAPRQRLLSLLSGEWRKVYTDYITGKFDIRQLSSAHEESMSVGVNALINQNGFRPDGSH